MKLFNQLVLQPSEQQKRVVYLAQDLEVSYLEPRPSFALSPLTTDQFL